MEENLKKFELQSYVHSKTLKTQILDGMLQLSFKVDSKVPCNVRVSCCVTEERNADNVPTMFYTPNREDYVQSQDMQAGMKQDIIYGVLNFKMSALTPYELT